MGSSILGTSVSFMVAYANLAPSGDHQWAIWEWKISSGTAKVRLLDWLQTQLPRRTGSSRGTFKVPQQPGTRQEPDAGVSLAGENYN